MKKLRFYKWLFFWVATATTAHTRPALAECESLVKSKFRKRSVEMEMALIAGEISDLEASGKREALAREIESAEATCLRRAAQAEEKAEAQTIAL